MLNKKIKDIMKVLDYENKVKLVSNYQREY